MDIEVILTESHPKLGEKGSVVKVAPGFATNFLFPQGKAKLATRGALKVLKADQARDSQKKTDVRLHAEEMAKKISQVNLTLEVQTADGEKLYGSVTASEIREALLGKAIVLDKKMIQLTEPIKRLGTFEIPVKLHREIQTTLKVTVLKKK